MSLNPFEFSKNRNVQVLFTGNYYNRVCRTDDPPAICTFCKEITTIWFCITGAALACGECALVASEDSAAVAEYKRLGGIDRPI